MLRLVRYPLLAAWLIVGLVWLVILTARWWGAPFGGLLLVFGFGAALLGAATALLVALLMTAWSLYTEPATRRWWNVALLVVSGAGLGWQLRYAAALLGM